MRRHAIAQVAQGFPCLDATVEDIAIDSHVAIVQPLQQPVGEVRQRQLAAVRQAGKQAKGLGTVVRPLSGSNPGMCPPESDRWHHFNQIAAWQVFWWMKFIWHTKSVANQ